MIEKIKEYVSSGQDYHEIARWMLNVHLHKHIPLSLDDLEDTSVVSDEVEGIVDALKEEDYRGALSIAQDGIYSILEDQGFETNF